MKSSQVQISVTNVRYSAISGTVAGLNGTIQAIKICAIGVVLQRYTNKYHKFNTKELTNNEN